MSVVTDVFVIVGDVEGPPRRSAEDIVEDVAEAIQWHLRWDWKPKTISLMRNDWRDLQTGGKVAGSAAIWLGLNYAQIEDLEEYLKAAGFKHVTVWSHHENRKDQPPRVVSF